MALLGKMSITDLVRKARQGDLKAYEELIKRFKDMVFGYAYSITHDFHMAEDIAQETFITAYYELSGLKAEYAFSAWLRKVAFSKCTRALRSSKAHMVPLKESDIEDRTFDQPDRELENKELEKDVLDAIKSLTENQRTAVTLYYINGYSQDQVAEFLEEPVSTVKKRLHDARNNLKKRMVKMVKKTLTKHTPKKKFEKDLINKMVHMGDMGKIKEEKEGRLAIYVPGGPVAPLITRTKWKSDSIVVEFDARFESESAYGAGLDCTFLNYAKRDDLIKHREIMPVYTIRAGFNERYMWSSIRENNFHSVDRWSRSINVFHKWSSFAAKLHKWYHIKAEKLDDIMRFWVDDVLIARKKIETKLKKRIYVALQSVCCNVHFKNVNIYYPENEYLKSTRAKVCDPFADIARILKKYKPSVVKEQKAVFNGKPLKGFYEVRDKYSSSIHLNDFHGKPCNYITYQGLDQRFNRFMVDIEKHDTWNSNDDTFLEVEYFDNSKGCLMGFYTAWYEQNGTTLDCDLKGTQRWKKHRFFLQDMRFGIKNREPNLYIGTVRSEKNLYLHSIKVFQLRWPKKAYREVIRHFRREIKTRTGEWSVAHYLFHIALIYHRKLGDKAKAAEIMRKVKKEYPDTECIEMFKRMVGN
jgi:RNA polymerase sigma-70 factor (ECF subfamily)